VGLDVQNGCGKVVMKASNISGSFKTVAIQVGSLSGPAVFLCVDANNKGQSPTGSTAKWLVSPTTLQNNYFLPSGCNY
jgi:hypothetical protein